MTTENGKKDEQERLNSRIPRSEKKYQRFFSAPLSTLMKLDARDEPVDQILLAGLACDAEHQDVIAALKAKQDVIDRLQAKLTEIGEREAEILNDLKKAKPIA